MRTFSLLFCLLLTFSGFGQPHTGTLPQDYLNYHRQIARAHEAIADGRYAEALAGYEQVFGQYSFIFLRDYQAATQLALQTGQTGKAFMYLKKGIAAGWTWKSITRNMFLKPLTADPQWQQVRKNYKTLRNGHMATLNQPVRKTVKKLFGKDQRKALRALFYFSPEAQERYAERRFAPHSERQLAALTAILHTNGYPGEQLVGTDLWASVILSHHNSISQAYALQDTLYPALKPQLWQAVRTGQMSPYAYAKIEEWYVSIKSGHKAQHTGFLAGRLTRQELAEANRLRDEAGLSHVETINRLLAIQQQTGMKFYLPLHFFTRTRITD